MKGLANYKGNDEIIEETSITKNYSTKKLKIVSDLELLIQELQNFYHIFSGECFWDIEHGLSKEVLFSKNKEAISSEIRNKTLKYYSDRVIEVYDIKVNIDNNLTSFSAKLKTIYGDTAIGGEY